jgi:radical SAM superfamily enzyme YgiQ (UPF0313 family)
LHKNNKNGIYIEAAAKLQFCDSLYCMHWKLILPALAEAKDRYRRSIKYSLFPPLGLATIAGYIPQGHTIQIIDEHVDEIHYNDSPDIVLVQVYVTNAYKAYAIADHYLAAGKIVILGGLHVTSLPEEAAQHATAIVTGPGDHVFKEVVEDIFADALKWHYQSVRRDLVDIPPVRRDLIDLRKYLAPNSLVVTRGCPFACDFCYKNSFFRGGKSYYTYLLDKALAEIDSLTGKHLFFLDDNILTENKFTEDLFKELTARNRLAQGAGTIQGITNGKLIELAAKAGLKSLFVGFESINKENMIRINKKHNYNNDYDKAVSVLNNYGIKINGSFVFGMDRDYSDVFRRTADWAIESGITTATFHILTPYPGTALHKKMKMENRIISENWSLYNTRNVVFTPKNMSPRELEDGYWWSYKYFYQVKKIFKSAMAHEKAINKTANFMYAFGWKKMELFWELIIKLKKLRYTIPLLETVLRN